MHEFLQRLYLGQVKEECERCFAAISAMNAALQSTEDRDPFAPAMEVVHHAAAVSRIFWPPGGKDKHSRQRAHRRGEHLRSLLALPSGHAVQNRALRDHFEHFDERLDDWAERSKNKNIVHRLIGPRSAIHGDAIQDQDIIHHYDPATKIYAFRGEPFDIQALATGLDDIYARAIRKLEELERRRSQRPPGA